MYRRTIASIQKQKRVKKVVCLTAYTTSIAKILDNYVDIILVGDSLGTVIYGMKNTQEVTLNMMMLHGKAVVNSTKKSLVIIDMPHQTYKNKTEALSNAKRLIKFTKCQSIKIETNNKNIDIVKHLTKNKIKVISHIGITPQKFKNFKNIRSVGHNGKEGDDLINLAIKLEQAGSCMIVLECIKENLAKEITSKLTIPTIGIGASPTCDGQILVTNDILNIGNLEKKPKYIKLYANINQAIETAVKKFTSDVINKKFPKKNNTY